MRVQIKTSSPDMDHRRTPYLSLTHVQQSGPVAGSPGQFALEQFAIEEAPGTAVFPRQRLATHVIDEQCRVHAGHKESSQLHAAGIHLLHLTANTQMKHNIEGRASSPAEQIRSSAEGRRGGCREVHRGPLTVFRHINHSL